MNATESRGRPTIGQATQDTNVRAHQYKVTSKPRSLTVYTDSIYRTTEMQIAKMLSTRAEEVPMSFSCACPDRQILEGETSAAAFGLVFVSILTRRPPKAHAPHPNALPCSEREGCLSTVVLCRFLLHVIGKTLGPGSRQFRIAKIDQ